MPDAVVLLLLGPLAAVYDFATNPMAPPAIFVAQFTEGFGYPPGANFPRPLPTKPGAKKRVYVTRPA